MKNCLLLLLLLFTLSITKAQQKIIPVKVVVVTMFENGADTGDFPGEFQYWVERMPLKDVIPFPQGWRNLRYNPDKQVLGICTGMGTASAAASIMALGMDPRFDLSKAYWLVAGIAGIDPADGTVGSAVWAEWLVDGDLAHQIDPREMPADWTTGYLPLRKTKPYELPANNTDYANSYHLNAGLAKWAYNLTKSTKITDTENLQKLRGLYTDFPEALKPPGVMMGDNLAASTYWHGTLMTQWANNWVKYWTGDKGNFVTSAMEDTGTAQALTFLSKAGKADMNRFMVLRTASNFTMQFPGATAIQSLTHEKAKTSDGYSAYIPSLNSAYAIGTVVVNELVNNWNVYQGKIPNAN